MTVAQGLKVLLLRFRSLCTCDSFVDHLGADIISQYITVRTGSHTENMAV